LTPGTEALCAPTGEAAHERVETPDEVAPIAVPLEVVASEPIGTVGVRPTVAGLWFTGIRAVGVVLLLFVAYALYGTAILEGQSQHTLDHATTLLHVTAPDIGLDDVVVPDDSRSSLAKGPGLVPGSGAPGTAKPIVIAGHRTTYGAPFRHLAALRPGQLITLRTSKGVTFSYEVIEQVRTSPSSELAAGAGSQMLFLVTANPPYGDHGRVVIEARLTNAVGAATGAQTVRLPSLRGSVPDAALAVIALGLLAAAWVIRARERHRLPGWAAWAAWPLCALLAFACWQLLLESMSRLL